MTQQIIIGVPGMWKDHKDVVLSIAQANEATSDPTYLAAGQVFADLKTKDAFEFEIYEHDPHMPTAFEVAGQGRFEPDQLKAIADHNLTVYLVCNEPSLQTARAMLGAGEHLLKAGGLGVKVETSGLAHTTDRWRYYAENRTLLSVYDALVTLVGGDEYNYTSGMHAFGLPDVSLTVDVPIEDAPSILNAFNQWHLLEQPTLIDGALFATELDGPCFRVTLCEYGYADDDLTNNPHGRWHLELTDENPVADSPYEQTGEPLFMQLANDDPEVVAAIASARGTLPAFVDHFASPYEYGHYIFKTLLHDGDESAHFWLTLIDASDEALTGAMFEVPPEFPNYHRGQELRIAHGDITDWCIVKNATVIGGFSRRLQRQRVEPANRLAFDLYSGMLSYAPLDELDRS